ncbi:hypothetical protein GOB50_30925 [Sinorhizobium meliloti]|nr:hypothetical protein [Sinorhizobium meliloti]
MKHQIPEAEFIDILKAGIDRTVSYMAKLTEYHGGPTETEYILTADIARTFLEKNFEVRVECLNRQLVNALSTRKGWMPREPLGSRRTDVAVLRDRLVPQAMVEVKIGVGSKLSPLRRDLAKMANTLECIDASFAARVRAASVFQIYVPGRVTDLTVDRLKRSITQKETQLRAQLEAFAKDWPDLAFQLVALQKPNDGFCTTEIIQEDETTQSLGRNGHATRYYAVLLKSVRREEEGSSLSTRIGRQ